MGELLLGLLNEKEKEVLKKAIEGGRTASSVVRELSRKKGWARSSIWYAMRKLKKAGIIEWEGGELRICSTKELKARGR